MVEFISEDDLRTFEGFLKYQAVDPAALTPDELTMWRGYFEEATRLRETRYLSRAVADLRQKGVVIDEQQLRRLSPLGWDHIIRYLRWP